MTVKGYIYQTEDEQGPTAERINEVIKHLLVSNALYVTHGSGGAKVYEARQDLDGNVEVRIDEGWRQLGGSALWDAEEQEIER